MSDQLQLSGSLTNGPPTVCDGTFPGSAWNVALAFQTGTRKSSAVSSGVLARQLNSASAFATLHGVGAADAVTHGNFLYLRCANPMQVRVSFDDGAGGTTLAVLQVAGLLMLEAPDNTFIKLLEAQGVGQLEYLVSGNS